ncbi:unnamed protein product [Lampetra planeri]
MSRSVLPHALLLPTAARAWGLLLLLREPPSPCGRAHARGGCTRLFVIVRGDGPRAAIAGIAGTVAKAAARPAAVARRERRRSQDS